MYLRFVKEKEAKEKKNLIKKIANDIYNRNPHGIGCLIERNKIVKAIDINEFIQKIDKELLKNANEFVLHARLATSGLINEKNTQPIKVGNVIVIHNGMFSEVDGVRDFGICNIHREMGLEKEKSDTFVFTEKLNEYKKNYNSLSTALKTLLEKTAGSLLLFVSDGSELLYVKHKRNFDFKYVKDIDLIVGATDINRILYLLKPKKKIMGFEFVSEFEDVGNFELEENRLYYVNGLINAGEKVMIGKKVKKRNIGRFKFGGSYGYY